MPLEALSAAVLVALLLDYWFGEPTPRWHPVVWMGRYLGWSGKLFAPAIDTRSNHPLIQFAAGALAWCLGAAFVACLAALLLAALMNAHGIVQVCLLGVLLKPMMAWRVLRDEVRDVELALQRSLPEGQRQVARLVSRDVKGLSPVQVRQAALSTLAENLNDSVVAPLFWFFVLGLPGAAV
ncbi:MAG TPA: CobD/CbiB family cobalamin biosynthesis protein, partial [Limnobacter sp.]|nr:CobD/CbiB family cobalamin biosynthesis protein [Limnobacter sp.]